jgi:hypothetical protein
MAVLTDISLAEEFRRFLCELERADSNSEAVAGGPSSRFLESAAQLVLIPAKYAWQYLLSLLTRSNDISI